MSLLRYRIRTVDLIACSEEEHGSTSPATARRHRTVQHRTQSTAGDNQASVRSKFRITDSELPPSSSISFDDLLEEVMEGRSQEWISKEENYLPSCFDWLLKDDKEVMEMLDYEQKLIRHQYGREPWESLIFLAHQAARQDPGMFLLAEACLDHTMVVAVPFKGEGSFFVELDIDNSMHNMRLACRPSAPGGRRLSLSYAGVSDDGVRIKDSAKSSWAKYVIGHAQGDRVLRRTLRIQAVFGFIVSPH